MVRCRRYEVGVRVWARGRGQEKSLRPKFRSVFRGQLEKTGDVTLLSEIKVMGDETYAIGQSVSNAFLLTGKKLTL